MISYYKNIIEVISDSVESIKKEVYEWLLNECINTLKSGGKIIASGLGKNVPICEKFVGSMVSLGMDARFLHTNSAVHGDMGLVKDGDMVIMLTKSGETAESIYLARLLKQQKRKICMWLLTFCEESTLTREIPNSIVLKLGHEGDPWNIMPNNSTTINLIVLQGLVMQIARERRIDISKFRPNHPGGHIGELLKDD